MGTRDGLLCTVHNHIECVGKQCSPTASCSINNGVIPVLAYAPQTRCSGDEPNSSLESSLTEFLGEALTLL